jgi:hypothetical protein
MPFNPQPSSSDKNIFSFIYIILWNKNKKNSFNITSIQDIDFFLVQLQNDNMHKRLTKKNAIELVYIRKVLRWKKKEIGNNNIDVH